MPWSEIIEVWPTHKLVVMVAGRGSNAMSSEAQIDDGHDMVPIAVDISVDRCVEHILMERFTNGIECGHVSSVCGVASFWL